MSDKRLPSFMEMYLEYHAGTEPPVIFHRWAAVSMISTILGKNAYMQHGHNQLFPNMYIMLLGESGCRKDSAIKPTVKLLRESGFDHIASSKSSKEKFLMDLASGLSGDNDEVNELDTSSVNNLFESLGLGDDTSCSEGLIAAGEFNVFIGHGNIEFIDLLTDLWDYHGVFKQRFKTSKSIRVPNPYINLLVGNTAIGVSMSFPPEVIGQGFFSRLLIIHAKPTGLKITWPEGGKDDLRAKLVERLIRLRTTYTGEITFSSEARGALDDIYKSWEGLDDFRFKSYNSRRLTHLFKLCMVCAADVESRHVGLDEVIHANTILSFAEFYMSEGLGQFGKARNSDATSKILDALQAAHEVMDYKSLWKLVSRDLEKQTQLTDIINNLVSANKIKSVGAKGFVGVRPRLATEGKYLRFNQLTEYTATLEKLAV